MNRVKQSAEAILTTENAKVEAAAAMITIDLVVDLKILSYV